MGKPRVAIFDFACCEGCQLQIVNMEEEILDLLSVVQPVEWREAMSDQSEEYDIALIEGSITRPRGRGAAARRSAGGPRSWWPSAPAPPSAGSTSSRTTSRSDEVKQCVYGEAAGMPHLATYPTKAVHEVVKVDFEVHGCPMTGKEFGYVVRCLADGHHAGDAELPGLRRVQDARDHLPVRVQRGLPGRDHAGRVQRPLPGRRAVVLRLPRAGGRSQRQRRQGRHGPSTARRWTTCRSRMVAVQQTGGPANAQDSRHQRPSRHADRGARQHPRPGRRRQGREGRVAGARSAAVLRGHAARPVVAGHPDRRLPHLRHLLVRPLAGGDQGGREPPWASRSPSRPTACASWPTAASSCESHVLHVGLPGRAGPGWASSRWCRWSPRTRRWSRPSSAPTAWATNGWSCSAAGGRTRCRSARAASARLPTEAELRELKDRLDKIVPDLTLIAQTWRRWPGRCPPSSGRRSTSPWSSRASYTFYHGQIGSTDTAEGCPWPLRGGGQRVRDRAVHGQVGQVAPRFLRRRRAGPLQTNQPHLHPLAASRRPRCSA